jgi:nicotinamide mononucleotide transporter
MSTVIDWLTSTVAPLNAVLFTLGNDAVSWAELLGFLTGGLCVWLTVRAHLANFAVGILNSALFLVLFLSARLWADAALQGVFIVLGFTGWWQWIRGRAREGKVVAVASPAMMITLAGAVVAATGLLTWVLTEAHDSAPFWDALTTSLSLAAQYLLNARKVQTWWFWIAADVIYIPLYVTKKLDLTAIVYVLFLGLCFAGWRAWRREYAQHSTTVPVVSPAVVP